MTITVFATSGAIIRSLDIPEYLHFIGSHVANGLTATFTGSTISIAAGKAVIDGLVFESDSIETISNTNGDSYVYALITYSSGVPTSGAIQETSTLSVATGANKLLLFTVARTGTTIDSITHNEGVYQLILKHGIDSLGINKTNNILSLSAVGSSNQDIKLVANGDGIVTGNVESLNMNLSDATSQFTTGTKQIFFPSRSGRFVELYGRVNTAPSGTGLKFNVSNGGTNILDSTGLTFSASSKVSNKGVFTSTGQTFSAGDSIEFKIDTVENNARFGFITGLIYYN